MVRVRLHVIADVQGAGADEPIFGIGGSTDVLQIRIGAAPVKTFNVGSVCCCLLVAAHAWLWAITLGLGFYAYIRVTGDRFPTLCW